MIRLLFLLFCFPFFLTLSQNLDNLSKKELKEFLVKEQNKSDSLQSQLIFIKKEKLVKDSIIRELNSQILTIEQKLNKLEFESSSCKFAHDSIKNKLISIEKEVSKLSDSLQKSTISKAVKLPIIECSYKEEKLPDCDSPITLKSCILANYKNLKTGEPDFEGNYSFTYDLFKKVNGKYLPIKNGEMFNAQKMELLEKINVQVKQNFDQFLIGPNGSDCFEGAAAPFISYDDLSIHFGIDSIEFIVKYSIEFSCFSNQGTTISFPISEIVPYLNL